LQRPNAVCIKEPCSHGWSEWGLRDGVVSDDSWGSLLPTRVNISRTKAPSRHRLKPRKNVGGVQFLTPEWQVLCYVRRQHRSEVRLTHRHHSSSREETGFDGFLAAVSHDRLPQPSTTSRLQNPSPETVRRKNMGVGTKAASRSPYGRHRTLSAVSTGQTIE